MTYDDQNYFQIHEQHREEAKVMEATSKGIIPLNDKEMKIIDAMWNKEPLDHITAHPLQPEEIIHHLIHRRRMNHRYILEHLEHLKIIIEEPAIIPAHRRRRECQITTRPVRESRTGQKTRDRSSTECAEAGEFCVVAPAGYWV